MFRFLKNWKRKRKIKNKSHVFIKKKVRSYWEKSDSFDSKEEAKQYFDNCSKAGYIALILRNNKITNKNYRLEDLYLNDFDDMETSEIRQGIHEGWINSESIPDDIYREVYPDWEPDEIADELVEYYDQF